MSKPDDLYRLHRLLDGRRSTISRQTLIDELEISRSKLTRLLAILRFTAHRARWVADETWHPDQQSRWVDNGHYELSVPYSNDKELIMDILKYGPDVEVIAPDALKESIKIQLDRARSQYG